MDNYLTKCNNQVEQVVFSGYMCGRPGAAGQDRIELDRAGSSATNADSMDHLWLARAMALDRSVLRSKRVCGVVDARVSVLAWRALCVL